jgi:hypothetical protein
MPVSRQLSPEAAINSFCDAVAAARKAHEVWVALHKIAEAVVPCRLFTVMTVDNANGLARRAYTSDPKNYPVSGTKPIHKDRWFSVVHDEKRTFVANTIVDIATVFPDFELIKSLGCGAVINLPVVLQGELKATINLLDAEQAYTPDRVALAESRLRLPAMLAVLAASQAA